MKQILISIKPEWVEKILNGEKTLEIRKSAPKELPCEVYIYCTKSGLNIEKDCGLGFPERINGKVVARFTLDGVFLIHDFLEGLEATAPTNRHITIYGESELLKESCLSKRQIEDYGGVYAWHISNLEILDEPKDLSEFYVTKKYKSCDKCPHHEYDEGFEHCVTCEEKVPLKRAPQSWCYVEELL